MVYWQMKELRWYGVDMTKEASFFAGDKTCSKIFVVEKGKSTVGYF